MRCFCFKEGVAGIFYEKEVSGPNNRGGFTAHMSKRGSWSFAEESSSFEPGSFGELLEDYDSAGEVLECLIPYLEADLGGKEREEREVLGWFVDAFF